MNCSTVSQATYNYLQLKIQFLFRFEITKKCLGYTYLRPVLFQRQNMKTIMETCKHLHNNRFLWNLIYFLRDVLMGLQQLHFRQTSA